MRDDLGDRMKHHYESRAKSFLPCRTYTVLRADGKAFHTYTRGLKRPFDEELMHAMNSTLKYMCENIEGAKLGYVQSDEISILLTDLDTIKTQGWFDGEVQKIASVAASMATAGFNEARTFGNHPALFDCRVFTIPDRTEVLNYFIWRQNDCTRNSIQMAAQSVYSHKQLHGVGCSDMQELLFQKGINWNDYPEDFKRGRACTRDLVVSDIEFVDKRSGETKTIKDVERHCWSVATPPIFTKERDWLDKYVPSF